VNTVFKKNSIIHSNLNVSLNRMINPKEFHKIHLIFCSISFFNPFFTYFLFFFNFFFISITEKLDKMDLALQSINRVITGKTQVETTPKKRTPTIKNSNNSSDDEMFDSLIKEIELNSIRTVNIVGWKLESEKMGFYFLFFQFFFYLICFQPKFINSYFFI
jgi:hypothetical protein